MPDQPTRRSRRGAAVGLAGTALALALLVGAGPAPSALQLASADGDISGNCDEAEHANDPECRGVSIPDNGDDDGTSTTVDATTSTTGGGGAPGAPADDVRSIDAAGAGTVIVAVEQGSLRLVTATPATGWTVEVEQSAGREVEVDFRSGTRRVQVNVEIEDGAVRERVRVRDDADGTDIRFENGVLVRDDSGSNSGPGPGDGTDDHSNSGPGSGDGTDDNSNSGPDEGSNDNSNSGPGDGG